MELYLSLNLTICPVNSKLYISVDDQLLIILYIIDVVDLHPNIPHGEGLIALRKSLEYSKDKTVIYRLLNGFS